MIFYFSATGNSKHVACQLANATGDKAVNILDYSLDQPISLMDEKVVGIITPVYCGGVPYPVADFLKKAKLIIDKDAYFYFVGTYGNLSGRSGSISGKYLKKNIGRTFDATYGVCMPDTWTPVFDLTNREQLAEINRKAEKCPTQTIHVENGKPVWTKKNCAMCLRCLHYCPQFAIQYGGNTKKHGQYHYPGVDV